MDGWITIGTKLDNKQLDRDLKDAQRRLQQFEKENERLTTAKSKVEIDLQAYEKQKQAIQESTNAMLKLAQTEEQVNNVLSTEEINLNTLNQQYSEQFQKVEEINQKLQENAHNQDLVKNEIQKTAQELNKMKGFDQINNSLNEMSFKISNIISKVGKWALAVFGVRSAYMFIRQAINSLSGYNEQIGTDVEYIRFALASALQPVIEGIINLAYKLLVYTAYIAKAWFGVNIFANATAKAFQKTNKAVKATNKSAKELQKTLTGFDEMNILQEDGSTALGGGGGGVDMKVPSVDLSDWESVEIPKWIEWIANNKDTVLGFFEDLVALIVTIKIASFFYNLLNISKVLEGMSGLQLFGMLGGIATTVYGIYQTISGLIDWLIDPTWENFKKVLDGLETVLIGIGIALVAINVSNPLGWIMIGIGAIGKFIDALSDNEEHVLSVKEATEQLKEAEDALARATDSYVSAVDKATDTERQLKEAQENTGISIADLLKLIEEEHLDYKDMNDAQKEVYKAYLNNESAQKNLKKVTKELNDANKKVTKDSIEKQLAIAKETGNYDELKKSIVKAVDEEKISMKEARAYILRALEEMDEKTQKAFVKDIPKSIMKAYDKSEYEGKWYEFETWWNNKINSLSKNVKLNITADVKANVWESQYTIKKAKGGIISVPKLASGSILNKPGKGVPVAGGRAIAGEAGREAYLPLSDTRLLEELGATIGRYITINATMVNQMNGRVISRELQRVQSESDFGYNR